MSLPTPLREIALVDGALLASSGAWRAIADSGLAVSLYDDLGDEARSVGPWLVPPDKLSDLRDLPLPHRLGLSTLYHGVEESDLSAHFRRIRAIACADDQRFFLRYADTRALGAMQAAWPAKLLARIKGPVARWTWTDRTGRPAEFGREVKGVSSPLPSITSRQLDALIAAGEADQMAQSLEELRDEEVFPVRDAEQFDLVCRALDWCRQNRVEYWLLRRSVARQFIRTAGVAAQDSAFAETVRRFAEHGNLTEIDAWSPKIHTTPRQT